MAGWWRQGPREGEAKHLAGEYTGMVDCFVKTVRHGSRRALELALTTSGGAVHRHCVYVPRR